jgi:hypothetical protein
MKANANWANLLNLLPNLPTYFLNIPNFAYFANLQDLPDDFPIPMWPIDAYRARPGGGDGEKTSCTPSKDFKFDYKNAKNHENKRTP